MRIALIAKPGHADSGVGRYTRELASALTKLGHEVIIVYPMCPFPEWLVRGVRRLAGRDLRAFFENYPVWARYPEADIYHITSQNLATLMLFRRPPGKTVITVHDIIPFMTRRMIEISPYRHVFDALLDRIAIRGLRRASTRIAVSEYTRQTLVCELDYGAESIVVVHEAVG